MTTYHSGNQLLDPYVIMGKAQVQKGMHVADFGCGRTGHLVFPLAHLLGEESIVYAVDIMKPILVEIRKRAAMESFTQVHTIWSDIEKVGKTAIPEKTLDIVFIVTALSQVTNRHGVLEEAKRLLKNKGRIVIVDWIQTSIPIGPKTDHLVQFNDVITWANTRGLSLQDDEMISKYLRCVVLYKHE